MDYATPTTTSISTTDAAIGAVAIGVFFLLLLFFLVSYAVGAYLLSRLFRKAGVQQWIAWVPIYNSWKLLEIGGQQGFWAVLAFIPFVNIVSLIFIYISMYNIGLKLGKEGWFILLAIFIPLVWLIWLGFDDSTWPSEAKPVAKKTAAPKKAVS